MLFGAKYAVLFFHFIFPTEDCISIYTITANKQGKDLYWLLVVIPAQQG